MPSSDLLPGASNGAANAALFERVPGVDERTDTVRVAVSGSVLRLGGAGLTEPTVNGATGNGATGNGAAANGAAADGAAPVTELGMFGRTYGSGREPALEDWLRWNWRKTS